MPINTKLLPITLVLLSSALGYLLFATTPHGLAQSPDSVGYLKGAQGLLQGLGFEYVSNHWPPLYPLLISLVAYVTGGDVLIAARLLQAGILFSVCLLLTNLLSKSAVPQRWAPWVSLLVIAMPISSHAFYFAWSEPVYVLFLLLNFICLFHIVSQQQTDRFHILCYFFLGFTASLAFLSRYIGITLIIFDFAVLLLLLLLKNIYIKKIYIAIAALPLLLILLPWLIHGVAIAKQTTTREIFWHPIDLVQINGGLTTIGKWAFPWDPFATTSGLILGVVIIIFNCVVFLRSMKLRNENILHRFQIIIIGYLFFYITFLIFSISFIDQATPLDDRILFPVYICQCLSWAFCIPIQKPRFATFIVAIWVASLSLYALVDFNYWVRLNYFNGVELANRHLRNRAVLDYIKTCGANARIVTDTPWEFDLYLPQKTSWLPRDYDMTSGKKNYNYHKELERLGEHFDLIVVTMSDSPAISVFDHSAKFKKTHQSREAQVWTAVDFTDCSLTPQTSNIPLLSEG